MNLNDIAFEDVLLDLKEEIVADIYKHKLCTDQNGEDRYCMILSKYVDYEDDVPPAASEFDALMKFYRTTLRKDDPSQYGLYYNGDECVIVAKNVMDLL